MSQPGRLLKEEGDGLVEFRLVLLDHHQIVTALLHNRLGQASLAQEGIYGDDHALQIPASQEPGGRGDLVAFLVDRPLSEDNPAAMTGEADQAEGLAMSPHPPHLLAINGLALPLLACGGGDDASLAGLASKTFRITGQLLF